MKETTKNLDNADAYRGFLSGTWPKGTFVKERSLQAIGEKKLLTV